MEILYQFQTADGELNRGWDQTGSNAANLNWPEQFRLNIKTGASGTWILGLVNAAPYFASAFM